MENNNKGYTLVEVMVGLALTVLVLSITISLAAVSNNLLYISSAEVNNQMEHSNIVMYMTADTSKGNIVANILDTEFNIGNNKYIIDGSVYRQSSGKKLRLARAGYYMTVTKIDGVDVIDIMYKDKVSNTDKLIYRVNTKAIRLEEGV